MLSISNKEIRTEDIIWAGEDAETKMLAIEAEFTTTEALVDVQMTWQNLIVKLPQEWTPQKLKDYWYKRRAELVNTLRRSYADCTKRMAELALENRDARVKGQSFKERKTITDKIAKIKDYQTSLKDKAEKLKKTEFPSYDILSLVEIEEMDIIEDKGIEYLLNQKFPNINYIN